MQNILILIFATAFCTVTHAQLHLGNEATLATGSTTISTNASLVSKGHFTWGDGSSLHVLGSGKISTTENWQIPQVYVEGDYDLEGALSIAALLQLSRGTLTPLAGSELIVRQDAQILSTNSAHINGNLYHEGPGEKFFPLGKNNVYTPVTLSEIEGSPEVLVGIEAFNENLNLQNLPTGIERASTNWYWHVTSSGQFEGSPVQLPLTTADMNSLSIDKTAVVLQANEAATSVFNLGNIANMETNPDFIISQEKAVGEYLMLGFESKYQPIVHNIISPSLLDGKNDGLFIENFEPYEEDNLVILLDRWGIEICRIENFRNEPAPLQGCDLTKLPSGNYICIVKYGDKNLPPTMITILK